MECDIPLWGTGLFKTACSAIFGPVSIRQIESTLLSLRANNVGAIPGKQDNHI